MSSGDYSRNTFKVNKHFSHVLQQQGRVALDADWNEAIAIFDRRLRAETVDIIGRCVVPRETPDGFKITISGTGNAKSLSMGRGRMYVHGLVAENHGDGQLVFDMNELKADGSGPVGVLGELIGDATGYDAQPHFLQPPDLPSSDGPHLVYLDVWQREVTSVDDETLLEKALGGVDTTTRIQTVWQVKLLADVGSGVTCSTPDAQIPGWLDVTTPSAGLLTTQAVPADQPDDPCELPSGGGYSGLENQLYRVEIHDSGAPGTATFKWSRENASVTTNIVGFPANDTITVTRVKRDEVLRFSVDDWVEITDDLRELRGDVGVMRRIASISEELQQITLSSALPADLIPSGTGNDTPIVRHTRIRKWDHRGEVRDSGGNLVVDLDDETNGGVIPIPAPGTTFVLERGVQVTFDIAPAGGKFRALDHWTFAGRTADRSVEELDHEPPVAIHHHYCRLAVVTFPSSVSDCRTFWPPQFESGDSCGGCSVCVTPESHNSGVLTIQHAIDQVKDDGGTVCLEPGNYTLGETSVVLDNARSVRLVGQGHKSMLSYAGREAAIVVRDSADVRINDLGIVAASPGHDLGSTGIALRNCFGARVNGVAIEMVGSKAADRAFELSGYQFGVEIAENAVIAPIGVLGSPTAAGASVDVPYLLLAHLLIRDNLLLCGTAGIFIGEDDTDGVPHTIFVGHTRLAGNTIQGGSFVGIAAAGVASTGGRVDVDANILTVSGQAIVTFADGARITHNDIHWDGKERSDTAISLFGTNAKDRPDASLVVGNRISGAGGHGILLSAGDPRGRLGPCIIKQNLLRGTGDVAVSMDVDAEASEVVIENNLMIDIARAFEDRERSVAAIRVHSVDSAIVAGNSIHGVATEAPVSLYRTAIDVIGCRVASVRDNQITGVGPPRGVGDTMGIFVQAPIESVRIDGNTVEKTPSEEALGDPWYAIRVLGTSGVVFGEIDRRTPLVVNGDARAFVLSNNLVRAVRRSGRLNVAENQVNGVGRTPAVEVRGGQECLFNGNQCLLEEKSDAETAVLLRSDRVIASNNTVRRGNERDAIHIGAEKRTFTVLGNITFGEIRLRAPDDSLSPLPNPWSDLNVVTP